MQRTYIKDLKKHIGKEVKINGWVDARRDHGKLIFLVLRDATGKAQILILPKHKEVHSFANKCRPEWIVEIEGKVNLRPEKMVKKTELNGELEVEALSLSILNTSTSLPFDISGDGKDINEEARLKYRYIDLRRERMQKNIRDRHKTILCMREILNKKGFVEIETPCLTKSTPEGSRDYIVPSRLEPGKFYALPQSPQQYKQLLMCAGFERYFQFARCFRDEDSRGDRQPEFTQLDMEMSFVEEKEVMRLNEELIIETIKKCYPQKVIQQIPFPRITFKEAMEMHKSDKPDLRKNKNDENLLAFCWVTDFPFFEKDDNDKWTFTHNPFSAPKKEYMNLLMDKRNIEDIITTQYDLVLNGYEIAGGSIRNHKPEALISVFEIMGYTKEKIKKDFGHMIKALESGAPPHGGIAWGFDRLMMLLENEPNIREVITFPKTGEGRDLMMNAPSEVGKEQLKELKINIQK
ncbi:MAG TPA: aspartate--tRNA ligase [Candidatus Pacearchaeota archaeon]|nr:aspartate--tRNA ligase [Candidatus Pacearchaeota archaeon]